MYLCNYLICLLSLYCMKKILFTLILVMMYSPIFSRDFTYEYEGQTLTYTVVDEDQKTCQTKAGERSDYYPYKFHGNNIAGNLKIPVTALDGKTPYTVIAVGEMGFCDCGTLRSVILPETLIKISDNAFAGCGYLTSVEVHEPLTEIGAYAFYNCGSLNDFSFPNTLTVIGKNAFEDCIGLTEIILPPNLTQLNNKVFSGCNSLQSIVFPENLVSIGEYTFYDCVNLSSPIFPASLLVIDKNAFLNCTRLKSVTLPESLVEIGYYAFSRCTGLTKVTLPESLEKLGRGAFSYCTRLSLVRYPASEPVSANSNVFLEIDENATLYVPQDAIDQCKQMDPWANFKNFRPLYTSIPDDSKGIHDASADINDNLPKEIYNLNGVKIDDGVTPAPGIYIIRQGNTVTKISVK